MPEVGNHPRPEAKIRMSGMPITKYGMEYRTRLAPLPTRSVRPPRRQHAYDPMANPTMIDGSRRKRIAQGSGTTIQAVNQLVKQFAQMRKMMAQLARGKMPDPAQLMKGMR